MPAAASSARDLAALRSLARRIDPSDSGAHNNLGVLYYERGLFPESIASFSRALELDPHMAVARRNLERVQEETGYYDRLIAELRERLRKHPRETDLLLELGKAYVALGQLDRAEEQFEALRRLEPGEPTAGLQLGLVEMQRGRQDLAARRFEEAARLDPTSSVARVHLAQALFNQGLADRALHALEDAVGLGPTNPDAHYLLGFVYGELGRHEEARRATRKAMELNPALGTAQANLEIESHPSRRDAAPPLPVPVAEPRETRAHLNLGLAFRRRGFLTDALREFRLALEAEEDRDAAIQGLAEVHLLRRDFAPALGLYEELLSAQPGHSGLWNDKATCLHQAGRRTEARAAWQRAVELDASNALAWNNLGVARVEDPDPATAVAALETAIRARSSLLPARLNLALLHAQRKQYRSAVDAYRDALRLRPDSAPAWNGIGQVLMELKEFQDARNAFARAVESDPESAVAHYNLGFCLGQMGRFDEALRETKRALEIEPYYAPQRFALAVDLQFEESVIPVEVQVSADLRTPALGQAFDFEPGLLDQVFAELAPEEAAAPVPAGDDPFVLARDLLAQGQLDAAAAEIGRSVRRGAPAAGAAVLEGEIFARRGLHGEAFERYQTALQADPESSGALLGAVNAMVALGRGGEALAAADRLVEVAPDEAQSHAARARARRQAGELAGARADAEMAARRRPGDADLLVLLGMIDRQLGDREAARRGYRAALQLDDTLIQAWYEAGALEEEAGNLGAARACYLRTVDLLPTHHEATMALAWVFRRQRDPEAAVHLLVDYLLAEPTAVEAMVLLGQVLLDTRRPDHAEHAFRRALHFDREHLAGLFHLGVACARQRRYEEAVAVWERVVVLAPTGPLAAQARRHARSARDLAQIFARGAA